MPTPQKGEKREEYISRCMAYPDMQKHPSAQRAAICFSMWKQHHPHSLGEALAERVALPYGLCPMCGAKGVSSDDTHTMCEANHKYENCERVY